MSIRSRALRAIPPCAAVLLLFTFAALVPAQSANDLSAFVGRWKIDLSRTHMGRGNLTSRAATFTFLFSKVDAGLNMDTYTEYPQPAPSRSNLIVPDGKPHTCQTSTGCLTVGGNAADQSFAYFQIDSHMLMRVFYIKGAVSEYTSYAVSSDGKTFTMIAWGAEAPDRENIQVFDKQP
jgi:hypothetical protein